jgi:lysozyme
MRATGVDISHWNDAPGTTQRIDFVKMATKADFVFIKASQNVPDSDFVYNWGAARAAGLLRGAYHYLDFSTSVNAQVDLFISLLKNDTGELPPIIDVEQAPPPSNMTALLRYFCDTIESELHVIPALYTGYYYWMAYGSQDEYWKKHPFWLAWWADESVIKVPPPWDKWTFWQYTNKGIGADYGVESAQIDLDYFNGTVDELRAMVAPKPPLPPISNGQYVLCPYCKHRIAWPK